MVDADEAAREIFSEFLKELRDDLNDGVSESDAIEMLAQHMVTRPVFEALFGEQSFIERNPVSKGMQALLDVLRPSGVESETEELDDFYESVKRRAEAAANAEAKQKLVVELYDKFFRNAFPKMTKQLGIVYTPVEVVDFIIRSVNDALQEEFGESLGSEGVHVLDPFTGTGTFPVRLIQSGLISPEDLDRKYRQELHANEIVLLAYYIAALNIEAAYREAAGAPDNSDTPFEGICLSDTFESTAEDMLGDVLLENSDRRTLQRKSKIRVIIGNPPWSAGQKSENDAAKNQPYPLLDTKIAATYAAQSAATNKNAVYDSYIRAIRWASDRIGDSGIIGLVTSAGWLDGNAMDGMRKCLTDEFSGIQVVHLRGNQRTQGELSRREGGKVFGSGSRAPVAVTILVKNPVSAKQRQIQFHDIGDYLTREQKLAKISEFGSIDGISAADAWTAIRPDAFNDWLDQRDPGFAHFTMMGTKIKGIIS